MWLKLVDVLACPTCLGELTCVADETSESGEIEKGSLKCQQCGKTYPIKHGIPRFVPEDNYAASFGYQWNRFRSQQIDSVNGTDISKKRFYSETGWTTDWLHGKWILDGGCGAGRFLDIASKNDCEVVGIDISTATDAARATLIERKNVHLVQGSIYEMPFRPQAFDGCYSIGSVHEAGRQDQALARNRDIDAILLSPDKCLVSSPATQPSVCFRDSRGQLCKRAGAVIEATL